MQGVRNKRKTRLGKWTKRTLFCKESFNRFSWEFLCKIYQPKTTLLSLFCLLLLTLFYFRSFFFRTQFTTETLQVCPSTPTQLNSSDFPDFSCGNSKDRICMFSCEADYKQSQPLAVISSCKLTKPLGSLQHHCHLTVHQATRT